MVDFISGLNISKCKVVQEDVRGVIINKVDTIGIAYGISNGNISNSYIFWKCGSSKISSRTAIMKILANDKSD